MNELQISKQRKYQVEAERSGRCRQCGEPSWGKTKQALCRKHFVSKSLDAFDLEYLKRVPSKKAELYEWVNLWLHKAERGRGYALISFLHAAMVIDNTFQWRSQEWKAPEAFRFAQWMHKWDQKLRGGQ